jgi:hypothetical protein
MLDNYGYRHTQMITNHSIKIADVSNGHIQTLRFVQVRRSVKKQFVFGDAKNTTGIQHAASQAASFDCNQHKIRGKE